MEQNVSSISSGSSSCSTHSSGHISLSNEQQNDSMVEKLLNTKEFESKQDVILVDKKQSSVDINTMTASSSVCCNQLNSLTGSTLLVLKHDYKQCVDRQKNGNNSSKINVDCLTTSANDAPAQQSYNDEDNDNIMLLQKLSINNPFYRFRKQSTSLPALNSTQQLNSTCELHKNFKLHKARSESKFIQRHATLPIRQISDTPLNLSYKLLDNNMIITNPFSIFHDEAELELNVQTNSLKKRSVKRPLQINQSNAQHLGFALNRFERQDFAQSSQSTSRKRAGQLLKKLALGKWSKATRTVDTRSQILCKRNADAQLKKLKISYPNHTQSWGRETPNEQSTYLSRLQTKTRQGLQKVRDKCRIWRQAATRPQAGSSSSSHILNPQLLDKEASFRYINDSAHISRYEAHCKQSLLYKSYKSEFELSKNLHYLDAYLQENFEQNLRDIPTSTGKSQSVGRISTRQRALMRQNMLKGNVNVNLDVDVDVVGKTKSKALMYEANLGIDEQILNNYTQSDSLPSDSLSSGEYASVFSGLHAKTGSIDASSSMERELYEGELQFASLKSFPIVDEENRTLKLEQQQRQQTIVGNLLPKLDSNYTNLNMNDIEIQQRQTVPVREHKKKFETRARERERERERNQVDDVSDTIDVTLLAHNQSMSESNCYGFKSLQKQQQETTISKQYDFPQRKFKRDNKERLKMPGNMEENIKGFEECNKIKYESYLEHFQRQQQYNNDESYNIYKYNNKLKTTYKAKEQTRNSGSEIENFYDDTFTENGLTTEHINADKREVTKKLCYMLTGEFTKPNCDPATGDATIRGERSKDDWVVSDTLRTYDVDKGSFVLSNGNVIHKIEQQQLNNQYGLYKEKETQQRPVKIKRKHSERYKDVSQQFQEVTLTPFLSAGVGNNRRSKSSNSSGGSRHFDDEEVNDDDDDDNDDENVDNNVVVNVENRYVVDTDSEDDNTKRNSFVNVFYSGNGCNVDVSAIKTPTTMTTTPIRATKHAHSYKLSTAMTNSGRFNNFTDQSRLNEIYKRPLTNTCYGGGGGGGSSSLNSSTLSTTSSSSSTTSQQHQLKYFTPTYDIKHTQTKHATKYADQSLRQQQAKYKKHDIITTTATSNIIGNYTDSRYTASGDYFERFLIKTTNDEKHENKNIRTMGNPQQHQQLKENTPAYITALNYYGTGAAVDSLYAHSTYAQQQQTSVNKIEQHHLKHYQQQHQLNTSSNMHAGAIATTTSVSQKRYQLMPTNTTTTVTATNKNTSTSTSRPQGVGYILEYEC